MVAEYRHAEEVRVAEVMTGPAGAVPILGCRDLQRTIRFYRVLGFDAEELPGYVALRDGSAEIHVSRNDGAVPGACLIRVPDTQELWRRWQDQDTLGPLDESNPALARFIITDPDRNQLMFISRSPGPG